MSLLLDSHAVSDDHNSECDSTPVNSIQGSSGSRTSSHGSSDGPQIEHVIKLSSIEHVMPRAYIRICLAYRVPEGRLEMATDGLRCYFKKLVEAKPYLAGYVTDVETPLSAPTRAEIRFTAHDYRHYPDPKVMSLHDSDGRPLRYEDLDAGALPPSKLFPEKVSALPPIRADARAPVLRVQGNIVEGGLIVSIYLHHCISDGTGFDLITSGDILRDEFTFPPIEETRTWPVSALEEQLKVFAHQMTTIRQKLSEAPSQLPQTRKLTARRRDEPIRPQNKPGRGCVMVVPGRKIRDLVKSFNGKNNSGSAVWHTTTSVLMALIWRHMTRARRPTIAEHTNVQTSRLLIPVNFRGKVKPPLPDAYFGAAVDSGVAELGLDSLTSSRGFSISMISQVIRRSIDKVDDSYVREMIGFANEAGAQTDLCDIQGQNMDRVSGADMYITSWLKMRTYQHDLGMGLGGPEWVRKPYSADPGSCIILPQKSENPDEYEVVIQMTKADMTRLLADEDFMDYVSRVID